MYLIKLRGSWQPGIRILTSKMDNVSPCNVGLFQTLLAFLLRGDSAEKSERRIMNNWKELATKSRDLTETLFIIFSGSAAQCGLWPPVALQPSAGYGLLWLCSPVRAMASSGFAAQCGLWPPVALQPSAGYGLLWLCSPARAMASSSHEVSWSHTTTRHSR
jgi:hypothetical protein